MRAQAKDVTQAGVAGAGVVDRDHRPAQAEAVEPGGQGQIVLDRGLLGDLEHDAGEVVEFAEQRLDRWIQERVGAEVDREKAVRWQLCPVREDRLPRRRLDPARVAVQRRSGEQLLRADRHHAVGEPRQPLVSAHDPARGVEDRLKRRLEQPFAADSLQDTRPASIGDLKHGLNRRQWQQILKRPPADLLNPSSAAHLVRLAALSGPVGPVMVRLTGPLSPSLRRSAHVRNRRVPAPDEIDRPSRRKHKSVADPRDRLPRPVHGRARRDRRERRSPLHSARAALLRLEPPVGRQRVHAHLRRLPAARRPRGRPARSQAAVRGRGDRVQRRLAAQRPRADVRDADRRPGAPGPRGRARLPRRALDHHDDIHRAGGAHQGARRLERDRGRRRRGRPAPRRRAHPARLVAVDLHRQRPGRDRDAGADAALHPRVARSNRRTARSTSPVP